MSGSHHAPEPGRDARYSLEDTIYDLPPVLRATAHPEHVLSGLIKPAPEQDGRLMRGQDYDTATGMERLDRRLKALELDAAVRKSEVVGPEDGEVYTWVKLVDDRLKAIEAAIGRQADVLQVLLLKVGE